MEIIYYETVAKVANEYGYKNLNKEFWMGFPELTEFVALIIEENSDCMKEVEEMSNEMSEAEFYGYDGESIL